MDQIDSRQTPPDLRGKRVLVAMSGGVDSSVAALLLKRQGCTVAGVTMCLGIGTPEAHVACCGPQAVEDARQVCTQLGIRHHVFDYAAALREWVVDPFVEEYRRGRTPNPCIECNRSLKFEKLLGQACAMGFDYLATGHYAAIEQVGGNSFLAKAQDKSKDQSYFLAAVTREALAHVLFPLGRFTKDEIRKMAAAANLHVASKRDSQDICFIPGGDYRAFLATHFPQAPGPICDTAGQALGTHTGLAGYTIGQRCGIGAHGARRYVVGIDTVANRVIVGTRVELEATGLVGTRVNLLYDACPERATVKIRSRQAEVPASLSITGDTITVLFDTPQAAVAPGQSAVFYDGQHVIGSAIIERPLTQSDVGRCL